MPLSAASPVGVPVQVHRLSSGRLALAQGLGKTLQTISFLSYMQTERGVGGPSLVVVPLSVLPSWMAEFKRWAPNMRVVRFHCNDVQERLRLRREVRSQCPGVFSLGACCAGAALILVMDMSRSACRGGAPSVCECLSRTMVAQRCDKSCYQ